MKTRPKSKPDRPRVLCIIDVTGVSADQIYLAISTFTRTLNTMAQANQTGAIVHRLAVPVQNIGYAAFVKLLPCPRSEHIKNAYNDLSVPLERTKLRVRHALLALGCATLADAAQYPIRTLLSTRRIGIKGFESLYASFERYLLFPWGTLSHQQIKSAYEEITDCPKNLHYLQRNGNQP